MFYLCLNFDFIFKKTETSCYFLSFIFYISLIKTLRIENSGRSAIYTFDNNSETVLVIITFDIPNKRDCYSSSFDRRSL